MSPPSRSGVPACVQAGLGSPPLHQLQALSPNRREGARSRRHQHSTARQQTRVDGRQRREVLEGKERQSLQQQEALPWGLRWSARSQGCGGLGSREAPAHRPGDRASSGPRARVRAPQQRPAELGAQLQTPGSQPPLQHGSSPGTGAHTCLKYPLNQASEHSWRKGPAGSTRQCHGARVATGHRHADRYLRLVVKHVCLETAAGCSPAPDLARPLPADEGTNQPGQRPKS